tara:strand:- start:323 stop:490 length:168 start_codon:yes stop_codon:yes gene_type:complete
MSITIPKKSLRIFLYIFVFLVGFLIFDSTTVVATVLFAIAALEFLVSCADQKASR